MGVLCNRLDDRVAKYDPIASPSYSPPPIATAAPEDHAKLFRVTGTSLHLRAEPSTHAEIRITLEQGEVVQFIERGEKGGFSFVRVS